MFYGWDSESITAPVLINGFSTTSLRWLRPRRKVIILLLLTVVAYLAAINPDAGFPLWAIAALLKRYFADPGLSGHAGWSVN